MGRALGISGERTRQLEVEAMVRLRMMIGRQERITEEIRRRGTQGAEDPEDQQGRRAWTEIDHS